MNKSQRKQIAKQIAQYERIIQNNDADSPLAQEANEKIMYITEQLDFEDMIEIDALVMKMLQK